MLHVAVALSGADKGMNMNHFDLASAVKEPESSPTRISLAWRRLKWAII